MSLIDLDQAGYMFKHTDVTDEKIRQGYRAGILVREIAASLGVTRNTIIGRAKTLGLSNKENLIRAQGSGVAREARVRGGLRRWVNASLEDRRAAGARLAEGRNFWLNEYKAWKATALKAQKDRADEQ